MQEALRLSRQQCVYANILWQDMLAAYGDTESSDYWRQRAQRRAYQGAVVYHLLQAGHCLATAVLKQLADTRMLATANLSLPEILTLLQEQSFLVSIGTNTETGIGRWPSGSFTASASYFY